MITWEHIIKENEISIKYFAPFDRLLEAKAEYYLKQEEEGKANKYLLAEIETMEKFREYAARLETMLQMQVHQISRLSKMISESEFYWKNMFLEATNVDAEIIKLLIEKHGSVNNECAR